MSVFPNIIFLIHKANTLYHLDGKGALIHLDKILAIDKIDAVQWQPGDGAGFGYKWIDIYRKIRKAGKRMHFIGGICDFRKVADDIGPQGLYFSTGGTAEEINSLFDEYKTAGEPPYRRFKT